ncbi:hypothetical protein GQ651_13145 [Alphaproteobacteria bacterium GH1-50]|uniref:Uncharacterized protein n=1 Tax=Kangsaoukella pontilimi TaxID=2691042 RepID=A0A7C9MS17_9RHOB|nr:hypothetical protein [Kangsaoukella pontilimi]MXQ08797.1 hypothetical protein [Kangsaoukella pontilimi]
MTLLNKLWAIGTFGVGLYLGGAVMLGFTPGLQSGIGLFERLGAVFVKVSAEIGPFLTGLGIIVLGGVLGVLSLFSDLRDGTGPFVDGDGGDGD